MKKLSYIFFFTAFISSGVSAQNSNKLIITDSETETSYKTNTFKFSDRGGFEFAIRPDEIITGPGTQTSDFKVVSGPATRVSVEGVDRETGKTIIMNVKICENSNYWPCAIIRSAIATGGGSNAQ